MGGEAPLSGSGFGFLLFSGSNDRAVLALCRAFRGAGLEYRVFARSDSDYLFRTSHRSAVRYVREEHELTERDLERGLEAATRDRPGMRWVVCPTSEYLVQRLHAFSGLLANYDCEALGPEEHVYATLTNKWSFRNLCESRGLHVPARLLDQDGRTAAIPFVAKPKVNLGADGSISYPFLVDSEIERRRFFDFGGHDAYYLEEFVTGESFYLLYYFGRAGDVAAFSQRNLLQQGRGKSILLATAAEIHREPLSAQYVSLLRDVSFRGFIMVEVRRRPDGRFFAIEANPRCWGPFQLICDAQAGLVEAFLSDFAGRPVALRGGRGTRYLWSGGLIAGFRSGQGVVAHERFRPALVRELALALSSDVYLRRDSWRIWLEEFTGVETRREGGSCPT